jgi:carbon storage regulator CsrA
MLVLSRKVGEEIVINGNIRVRIVQMDGGKVRIGIVAPDDVSIDRQEIHDKKKLALAEWATPIVIADVGLLAIAL